MTLRSMQIGRWALACAEADLQLGVPGTLPDAVEEPPDDGTHDPSWTLSRFRDRFGTQWVPGRVVVSAEALEFRPRVQNNAVPLALRLGQVSSIEPIQSLFNKGMRVRLASGQVLTFRCRSAYEIVETLQSAAGAVRSSAA